MLCPNCKKEIPEGTQFCSYCGADAQTAKKTKKPITKKWWFWVIIVVVLIGLIGAIGGGSDDESTPANGEGTSQSQAVSTTNSAETTTETTTIAVTEKTTVSESEYKASCEKIAYKDIARLPDDYVGKNVVFTGEVVQVQESSWSDQIIYRINVAKDDYGFWDDTVYVTYELPEGAPRILEEDIVTFYGVCEGTYTYESVLGSNITIPSVSALYIDIQ